MCAEKVDKDCSMDCSSPISASTVRNTDTVLPSRTGGSKPHMVIKVNKPIVFKVTVLPPVLGPVITSVSKLPPSSTSIGTTFLGSINGCLALFSTIRPSSVTRGTDAFI